jgi:uncharacterized protein (DUF362 family)
MIREELLGGPECARLSGANSLPFLEYRHLRDRQRACSNVAILKAEQYSETLAGILWRGLQLFSVDVRGKVVLLKPNLVDSIAGAEINTHPMLVVAAAECFRRLGALEVLVAEGPGHQRDTDLVLSAAGFSSRLREHGLLFVDLNRDYLVQTKLRAGYTKLQRMWLPRTVLAADFVVSMPKVKCHHWAGVTLAMKNMFGVVPGLKYGWPKNILHWRGIQRSIVDLAATVPIHFVIADAIVCMEGNGPLAGMARGLNRIVLSDDPVAADATCARLMGFAPERIPHIAETAKFLGNASFDAIRQLAEPLVSPSVPFNVVPEFEHLRATCRQST